MTIFYTLAFIILPVISSEVGYRLTTWAGDWWHVELPPVAMPVVVETPPITPPITPPSKERVLYDEHAVMLLRGIREVMDGFYPAESNDKHMTFFDISEQPNKYWFYRVNRKIAIKDNDESDWDSLLVERLFFWVKRVLASEQQYIILNNVSLFEQNLANVIRLNFDNSHNVMCRIRLTPDTKFIRICIERRKRTHQVRCDEYRDIAEDEEQYKIEDAKQPSPKLPYNHKISVNTLALVKAMIRWNLANFEDIPRFSIDQTWKHYEYATTKAETNYISQKLSEHGVLLPQGKQRNKAKAIDLDLAHKFLAGELVIT